MNSKTNFPPVIINKTWCKDCLICKEFCPQSVFEIDENGKVQVAHPEKCTLCGLCQLRCPDFAIKLEELNGE